MSDPGMFILALLYLLILFGGSGFIVLFCTVKLIKWLWYLEL